MLADAVIVPPVAPIVDVVPPEHAELTGLEGDVGVAVAVGVADAFGVGLAVGAFVGEPPPVTIGCTADPPPPLQPANTASAATARYAGRRVFKKRGRAGCKAWRVIIENSDAV